MSRMQNVRMKSVMLFTFAVAIFVSPFQLLLPRTATDSSWGLRPQYLAPRDCPTPPCFDFHPERFLRQHQAHMAIYQSEINQTRNVLHYDRIKERRLLSPRLLVFQKRYIFCHVHKNGGTALHQATRQDPDKILLYNRQEKEWGTERFDEEVKRVQSFPNVTYFSFVRDPVSRYLSAVRQVLKTSNQRRVSLENDFAGCTEENLTECALDRMEHSFLNPHFLPQVLELRRCLPAGNTSITLTDMANLNEYVKDIVNVDMGSRTLNWTRKELPGADLVARICRLYKMDVDLIRRMGSIDSPCLQEGTG